MVFIPAPIARPMADTPTPIDSTLAVADTAEDLVTVPSEKVGRSISVRNEGPGKAYLAFDTTATTNDVLLKKNESYAEHDLALATKVSFIGESGKQPRVIGVLWSSD